MNAVLSGLLFAASIVVIVSIATLWTYLEFGKDRDDKPSQSPGSTPAGK